MQDIVITHVVCVCVVSRVLIPVVWIGLVTIRGRVDQATEQPSVGLLSWRARKQWVSSLERPGGVDRLGNEAGPCGPSNRATQSGVASMRRPAY